MLCDWEGNRRSGVAPAMRHRLQSFIHLRAHGLRQGEEQPAWGTTPLRLHVFPSSCAPVRRSKKGVCRRPRFARSFPRTWRAVGSAARARCRRRRGDAGAGRRPVGPGSAAARRALQPRAPVASRRHRQQRRRSPAGPGDDRRRRAAGDGRRRLAPDVPTC